MIELKRKDGSVLQLPQSYKEISAETVNDMVSSVKLAEGKALVCLVNKTNLRFFRPETVIKNKNDKSYVTTIPFLVDAGNTKSEITNKLMNEALNKCIIINEESLIIGSHVSMNKNYLSMKRIYGFLKEDKELHNTLIAFGTKFEEKCISDIIADLDKAKTGVASTPTGELVGDPDICYLEFKIVSATDIYGYFNDTKLGE